jgi:hypothetical protein
MWIVGLRFFKFRLQKRDYATYIAAWKTLSAWCYGFFEGYKLCSLFGERYGSSSLHV